VAPYPYAFVSIFKYNCTFHAKNVIPSCCTQCNDSDKEGGNIPGEERSLSLKCGSVQVFGKESSESKLL
jgi:hypothetical protein